MRKGQKLYSILRHRCPSCHEGALFLNPNPYNVRELAMMPKECPVCSQRYEMEPGFFYGAMFVSYALTVALSVAVFVAMVLLWQFDAFWYLIINTVAILVLFPLIFRTARAVWLNFFVSYRQHRAEAA